MTVINNGQNRIQSLFVQATRPELGSAAEPSVPTEAAESNEAKDQTEQEIKASVANKTDAFMGKVIGGTSISATVVKGDATGAALEAAKAMANMTKSTVVAEGVTKGATVVSGAVAAASGDHFAAAATAKKVLQDSPNLSKLSVVADAVMLATGDKKLTETVEAVKKEAKKVVSPTSTTGDRWKSGLKLAQHTQSGVILSQQLAEAIGDLGRWLGKAPAFAGASKGIAGFTSRIAASPIGKFFRKLGKFMPVLNFAALANSVRIAVDIWRDPRSSKTSKTLVAGSVASGVVLFGASIVTGGAALVPAAAAFGVATELGLMSTRKRDLEEGNTDRQMAGYLANPVEGAKAFGAFVGHITQEVVSDLKNVAAKLGDKLTGRAPVVEKKAAPSGRLGAAPKFD
jgi:hypothetical protein